MKALIVDDDTRFSATVSSLVRSQGWTVFQAGSVSEADQQLDDHKDLDLLILDRNLPPAAGLAASEEFGDDFMRRVREGNFDGAVIGLTGFRHISQLEEALARPAAPLRVGPDVIPRVEIVDKYEMDDFSAKVSALTSCVSRLDTFTIYGPTLHHKERRAVAHLGLARRAIACDVWRLGGGMSGDSVLKVKASYEDGHSEFALLKIMNERKAVEFSLALPSSLVAGKIDEYEGFLGRHHVNVYPLVDGHVEMLSRDPLDVSCGKDLLKVNSAVFQRSGIGEPRPVSVSKAFGAIGDFSKLCSRAAEMGIPWPDEGQVLPVKWGRCHGDLHAANILIDDESQLVVIDLESSSEGSLAVDVCALYFSWLFNKNSKSRSIWPKSADAWDKVIAPASASASERIGEFFSPMRSLVDNRVVTWREIRYATFYWSLRFLGYSDVRSSEDISASIRALIDWALMNTPIEGGIVQIA